MTGITEIKVAVALLEAMIVARSKSSKVLQQSGSSIKRPGYPIKTYQGGKKPLRMLNLVRCKRLQL